MLVKLVDLGGTAIRSQFAEKNPANLNSKISSLENHCLIQVNGDRLIVTKSGKTLVAERQWAFAPAKPKFVGEIAQPRTPAVTRTLKITMGAAPYRPGMNDHLSIPSLMGTTRKLPSGEIVE